MRIVIRFTDPAGGQPAAGATVRVCGAVLSTGPANNLAYFDDLSPGAVDLPDDRARLLADERQALCKTDDAIVPEVTGKGRYLARFSVALTIPAVFWRDPVILEWNSRNQPSDQTRIHEVTNLQGATAPIEDAVFIVHGPASSHRLTDPRSGAWVQLQGDVPAGQTWLVDAAGWRSGRGAADLGPSSGRWSNDLAVTDYNSPRAALMLLSPQWDPDRGDHIVRLSLMRATRVQVFARRKWL